MSVVTKTAICVAGWAATFWQIAGWVEPML